VKANFAKVAEDAHCLVRNVGGRDEQVAVAGAVRSARGAGRWVQWLCGALRRTHPPTRPRDRTCRDCRADHQEPRDDHRGVREELGRPRRSLRRPRTRGQDGSGGGEGCREEADVRRSTSEVLHRRRTGRQGRLDRQVRHGRPARADVS